MIGVGGRRTRRLARRVAPGSRGVRWRPRPCAWGSTRTSRWWRRTPSRTRGPPAGPATGGDTALLFLGICVVYVRRGATPVETRVQRLKGLVCVCMILCAYVRKATHVY